MRANDEKLLFKDEVFQIVGSAIEVLNALGHGIVEKPYENALLVEFRLRKIRFASPESFRGCRRRKSDRPDHGPRTGD